MINIIKSKIYDFKKRKAKLSSKYDWEILKRSNDREVFYDVSTCAYKETLNVFFIEEFKDKLHWKQLSANSSVDIKMLLEHFKDYVYWYIISTRKDLSDELLILYFDYIRDSNALFDNRVRSLDTLKFLVEKKQLTDWEWIQISQHQRMDRDFIIKYQKYLYPYYLKDNQNVHLQLRQSIPTTYDNEKRGIYN